MNETENQKIMLDDEKFFKCLISVLKNSFDKFNEIVEKLQLKSLVSNQISFRTVASLATQYDFNVPNYKHLQDIANNYKNETEVFHKEFKKIISEFMKPIQIVKSTKTIEIKKEILISSEFTSQDFDSDIEEFQIFCDTLHIDSDLPQKFRGKNIAIISNFIQVHHHCTWDLSGNFVVSQQVDADAGQDDEGKGKNGIDGIAGNSGGNLTIECKSFKNSSFLTIISNGSNGTDAQNGGNGRDGKNGRDAELSDFLVDGELIKVPYSTVFDKIKKARNYKEYSYSHVYSRVTFETDTGLEVFIFCRPSTLIALIKGGSAQKGMPGGIGGYAGEAGYAGEINIHCDDINDINNITIIKNPGRAGKGGVNGINGVRGREGRDIYKFDYRLWSEPELKGHSRLVKFKIVREERQSVLTSLFTVGLNMVSERKILSNPENCYYSVEFDHEIQIPSAKKYRNDSTLSRSKMPKAVARKIPPIDMRAVKTKSTQSLSNSIDEISNKISQYNSIVSESTEHQEVTKKHKLNLSEKCTSRQINFGNSNNNKNKKKKNRRKAQNITRKHSESLTYDMMRSPKITKSTTECFELLRNSELNIDQLNCLTEKLNDLNIIENEGIDSKNTKSSDILWKNFIGEYGDEAEENAQQILDENSQFNFVVQNLYDMLQEQEMKIEIIGNMCEEKRLLLFYKEIFKKFNQIIDIDDKIEPFSFDAVDFSNQFLFLRNTKNFISQSEELDRHFNLNSQKEKDQIIKYFNEKCKMLQFSFPESIFNHLIECSDRYKEISTILKQFDEKVTQFDEKLEEYQQSSDASESKTLLETSERKKAEFDELLKKFYDNKEIQKFIKNELKVHGVNSPLYRRILAHKSGFKFVLCRENLDNQLKVFEWHNYGDDLRFDYKEDENNQSSGSIAKIINFGKNLLNRGERQEVELESKKIKNDKVESANPSELKENEAKNVENQGMMSRMYNYGKTFFNRQESQDFQASEETSDEVSNEIFILSEYQKFYILNFEKEKYKKFKMNEKIEESFKDVELILENLHNTKINSDDFKFLKENSFESLREMAQKFKIKENKFGEIFKRNDLIDDEDFLFESIISNFPQSFFLFENEDVYEQEVDKENLKNFQNAHCIVHKNEEDIRAKIKCVFSLIMKIGGITILKAIAIRLFNDKNSQNLEEFFILMKSILTLMLRNQGYVMPITFMILGNEQEMWIPEIVQNKIDSIVGHVSENLRNKWKNILKENKSSKILAILLEKISHLNNKIDDEEVLSIKDVDQIIENLNYFDNDCYENLKETNLTSWGLITTEKYWKINFEKLKNFQKRNQNFDEVRAVMEDMSSKYGLKTRKLLDIFLEKREDISKLNLKIFLTNFTSGKWLFCDEILRILRKKPVNKWNSYLNTYFGSEIDGRNANDIAQIMKFSDETSKNIKEKIDEIKNQIEEVYGHKCSEKSSAFKDFSEFEIRGWLQTSEKKSLIESLAIIARVFEIKLNVTLRDTQLTSVLTMWNSKDGVLMQVSTGEGKTFIAVAFAILKVLHGEKVDIITSSSVLAERDAMNEKNLKIFNFFNVKVDHNCHLKNERRKQAYTCDIVYGTLCNFQRDYLLTEFHQQKLMTGHHFNNILVDEVDSMLLDKGNNILYLSQDLPDIDEVESVFIFIQQWVNQTYNDIEEASKILNTDLIRKVVLDNAYGILDEDDIKRMQSNVDAAKVIEILKMIKIVGEENMIIEENFNESKISSALKDFGAELIEKITFYCRDKIQSEKQVVFPNYLKKFVLQHLNLWIQNAVRALCLENKKEYIIDRPKTGQADTYPDINILDLDTGTDMANSQWDEGLHQFIQLKYGCQSSPISLKSVFISNVSFFKKYQKLYGMTGTLGNLQERQKIMKVHDIDFATIPRHSLRMFEEYSPISKTNEDEWLCEICNEVEAVLNCSRSILIICETIQETQIIQKEVNKIVPSQNIHIYQRDTDNFDINELQSRQVIISTNLAGRGTDIKLSENLKIFGGLHVILTNLPANSRIEEQAFGRAARSGDNGSGRLIICTAANEPISKQKETRNYNELMRLDEISEYYENFIKIEEDFFGKFQSAYKDLKGKLTHHKEIYLLNFIIQWAFWLDKNSKLLDDWKNVSNKSQLQENFDKFLSEKKTLHPIMRIEVFKELALEKKDSDSEKILNNDFHVDLFVHQYFKLYQMLKSNQKKCSYKPRDLTNEEHQQIRKCIKMLNSSINNRHIKIQIVKYLKEKYQENAPPIEGFEKQQSEILQIFDEISNNLRILVGENINPETLGTPMIDKEIMRNELYEELINKNCLTLPQISKHYSDEDIKIVSKKQKIEFEELKKFLYDNRHHQIKSLKDFEEKIKQNFQLPSRVEFWNILIDKKILTNEIEYAIVDLNVIKNVDPSAGEMITKKFENEKLAATSSNKIFFTPINQETEKDDEGKLIVKMSLLKSVFSEARFEYLMKNNVIEINKEALFDIERFKMLKNNKLFEKFDKIHKNDFKEICKNYEKLIEKLSSAEINIITPFSNDTYSLNYENLEILSNPYDLNCDFVYHSKINELIKSKFSYRIAIEALATGVINETINPIISLHVSPHMNLLNDLIMHMIIDQAKVNCERIENITKIFENSKVSDILKNAGLDASEELMKELQEKNLINPDNSIQMFSLDNVNLSTKYQSIQSTVKVLLQNRRILRENSKNIQNNLKNLMMPLLNKDLVRIEVALDPIENLLPYNNFLNFIQLKGLGVLIKIQQQMYSSAYWIRFSIVLAFAIFQIIAGVAITLLFQGLMFKVGESIISEGIGDAIFALSSLRTGHFSWSDYGTHKMISVATSLTLFVGQLGFAKLKWFKVKDAKVGSEIVKDTTAIGKTIGGPLSGKTGMELIKEQGKAGLCKVLRETAHKTVINCKNVLIQTGAGIAADYIIKKCLNQYVEKIAEKIVHFIQKDFWSHEISSTIEKMLNFIKAQDFKKLIVENFEKIQANSEFYRNIVTQASNMVDTIIRSDQTTIKSVAVIASIVSRAAELCMVSYFVRRMYDDLNHLLKDALKSKREIDNIEKMDTDEIKQFKTDIVNHIEHCAIIQYRNSINSSIVKPVLVYAGTKIGKYATESIENVIKNSITKNREKKLSKRTAEVVELMEKHKKSSNPDEIPKELVNEAMDILAHTKNPEIHKTLMKQNIPMDSIGIECVRKALENEFGGNFNIIVMSKGNEIEFGNGNDTNAKTTITLDLANGHFKNSNKQISGNDCWYYAIADQYPELMNKFTPKQLRDAACNVIDNDSSIRSAINNNDKKFYMEIGLYGGHQNQQEQNNRKRKKKVIPGEKVESYGRVSRANPNRRGKKEADHIPSHGSRKGTDYEQTYSKGSTILIDHDVHRKRGSTGSSKSAQEFAQKEKDYLMSGQPDEALKLNYSDLHNKVIEDRKIKKESGVVFDDASSEVMNELHENFRKHADVFSKENMKGKFNDNHKKSVDGHIDKLAENKKEIYKANDNDNGPKTSGGNQQNDKNMKGSRK